MMLRTIVTAVLIYMALVAAASTRDIKGEFAQYTPEQREWLKNRAVPGKGSSCCSAADGAKAEEDIKGDQYWVTFEACYSPGGPPICSIKGPIPVPKEAVLNGPNKIGVPVVWYGWVSWDNVKNDGVVWIRCYSPGPGL